MVLEDQEVTLELLEPLEKMVLEVLEVTLVLPVLLV